MSDLIDQYARHQKRRGLSPNTIDKRSRSLSLFDTEVGLASATREDVEDWLDGRLLAAKSRSVSISHLACFYAWASAEGHLEHDPTARIQPPKLRRRLPRPVTDKELERLLAGTGPKLRAMLLLASLAGLRCCEIAGLEADDVMVAEGLVRVIGKGDKERVLPLHPDVAKALRALPLPAEGSVFSMSAGAVSHAIGGHIHSLGIQGGAHRLRHWHATRLYALTHDLRLVQELLGHASPATTAIYAGWDQAAARSAVRSLAL